MRKYYTALLLLVQYSAGVRGRLVCLKNSSTQLPLLCQSITYFIHMLFDRIKTV